jgi:pyrrolidone-carboxylate peptidase
MQTVLLTGFEPFDQDLINPSWVKTCTLSRVDCPVRLPRRGRA